jgi:hypothetical protein
VPETRRRLNVVLAVGIADALLLVVLVYVAFIDRNEGAISIIGPDPRGRVHRPAVADRAGRGRAALGLVVPGPRPRHRRPARVDRR